MRNSSSQNYSEKFKHIKKHQEKNKINFKSLNDENYNNPFKLSELTDAIKISYDTATGPDEINYQMLKHLPENALVTILQIFNDIWTTGVFQESWRLATIIPIPKPGKNPAEPTNYRLIALTRVVRKSSETDSIKFKISSKTSRGKKDSTKDTIIDITSDSQVNSNFPNRWSQASLTFNNYFYLFLYLYIT